MHIEGVRAFALGLGLFASGTALAASMWDWDDDFQSRHWRSATLTWAQNTHPSHPSLSWIQSNNPPPVHEMWCHYSQSQAPTPADCAIFSDRLETWLADFLDTTHVPESAFASFPKECQSICVP
jgi:hypothetical protein